MEAAWNNRINTGYSARVAINGGYSIIRVTHWPTRGTVRKFVESFPRYRYHARSINSQRAGQQLSRCLKL